MNGVRIFVRGQWRHRPETPLEAAARLSSLLRSLAEAHPSLAAWYKKSSRRPSLTAISAMPPTAEALEPFIKAGTQFKDMPREPWPELGFSVSAWNGALKGPSADFSLKIGAFDGKLAAFNRIEVGLSDVSAAESLVSYAIVRRVVEAVADTMEPSCLDVTTRRWMHSAPPGTDLTCPAGGWMSYIRNGENREFELPDGIFIEPMGHGVLLLSTPEDFSDANSVHLQRANLLNQLLSSVRDVENDLTARHASSPLGTTA
jgi:hypothetical protein